jgi:hypothetical protein
LIYSAMISSVTLPELTAKYPGALIYLFSRLL